MNGFQRFALLLLCLLAGMICYPNYTMSVWPFMGLLLALWTGVIMVMSVVLGILGLDRFAWANRLATFLLIVGIIYSILWYMPQEGTVKPIDQIRQGKVPSISDMEKGIKRLTFNFDFARRNARSQKNFINQQDKKPTPPPAKKPVSEEEQWQNFDITVE